MMPIIKKWLYSDKDIFLREIVANGVDAITKFKKLVTMGEAAETEGGEYCVKISVDKKAKTLTVEDNGIGMTEEEVENYITQIAFSGASDFLAKYEKAGGDGIIGHFGLGFYSAYMVSELVEIETKSYKEGAKAVKWASDGNSTYSIDECEKQTRGTKIIMHISGEEKEFLNEDKIKGLVKKYCSFMPYNIYVGFKGDGKDTPLNTTAPLYTKAPKDCTDEEYKNFYTDTFMDYDAPIFWVHLDMDYPFKLKGILYFPKVKNKVELERGKVKLYCNQVFIADNIKEVIPEFLMLLNGVIDCPDIPLNVSRSFLQNDKQVQRITKYIIKKVADKLTNLYKNDRVKFEESWGDLANFIKFGCIKENEFYDKIKDVIIWKDLDGNYKTLADFLPQDETEGKDKKEDEKKDTKPQTVYYVSDPQQQAQYVKMFKDNGLNAINCDTFIDPHFISFIEYKMPDKVKFMRIDADVAGALKGGDGAEDSVLCEIFKNAIADDKVTVKTQCLKNGDVPAIITVDEYMRRYSEMGQFYGMADGAMGKTLIVNTANSIVAKIKELDDDKQKFTAKHIYSLALLSFKKLCPEELTEFMNGNLALLDKYLSN
ncbi:MAG: molecular chaperone HtpG [Roseburia sp.]|nr:molecular chaperone HtpG [Roseburia sp.]